MGWEPGRLLWSALFKVDYLPQNGLQNVFGITLGRIQPLRHTHNGPGLPHVVLEIVLRA